MSLTVGETYFVSVRAVNSAGLTSDPLCSSGVTIAYAVSSIAAAKGYANGTPVAIPVESVSAKFASAFYMQEASRASGIRVESATGPALNYTVQVFGRLALINGCERALTDCKIVNGSLGDVVEPLLLNTSAAGGEPFGPYTPGITGAMDLNNLGLLVTITGKVTKKQTGYIYVDDGSALDDGSTFKGIRVDTSGLTIVPNENQQVVITGISSMFNNGTSCVRMIRPKGDAYITIYTP